MPDNTASLEAIIAEIRQQSATEIEAVRQAAAREQAKIEQRAQIETDRIRSGIITKARQNANLIRRRTVAVANLEVKKIDLQSRLLIIAEIRRRLDEWLTAYRRTPEYLKLLQFLIAEGLAGLGADDIRMAAGDRERELLTDDFLKATAAAINPPVRLSLITETLPEAGVILYSANNRMRFDNRLARFGQRLFGQHQWTIMQSFININQKS